MTGSETAPGIITLVRWLVIAVRYLIGPVDEQTSF